MFARDPYDPVVAFDDYFEYDSYWGSAPLHASHLESAAQSILEASRHRRARVSPMTPTTIEGLRRDTTQWSFSMPSWGAHDHILGAASDHLPLFGALRRQFRQAIGDAKAVRLDTDESYAGFRAARREPYLAALESRLAALEDAFARHAADHHGDRLDALEMAVARHVGDPSAHVLGGADPITIYGDALMSAVSEAQVGGTRIALPLPAWAEGNVECWQDGAEILCTARLCGPDGRSRYVTSATPARDHVEEVLGCAVALGIDHDTVRAVGPSVAQKLGGQSILAELGRIASKLLRRPEAYAHVPFVGAIIPESDATVAATMALLQRCQRGDRRALGEAHALAGSGLRDLLNDAAARLARAQRDKAKGRKKRWWT